MDQIERVKALTRSPAVGYAVAVALPVAITFGVAWLKMPAFVFEHLIVLLVVVVAIPWGLGPAVVAALTSVLSDNVLLREPIGIPTITGVRDVVDLALFATVAVVVSLLMRRAHVARAIAQKAAEQERQAREERDRVIATVTHDLATPLSVLTGTVQLARRRGNTADIDLSRLLVRLETASARATSLIKMLSDARALESDGFNLDLAVHDLRTLVSPIVQMMDRTSDRHPLILTAPDTPVMVTADADRLQRVLENLINNAIKYSPDGGTVDVSVTSEGDRAVLRVRDQGVGVSTEALPRIFDRLYRAPEASRHAPGLGLGLSIAAQIVARHGGTIEAEAADGGGSVFTVGLPLAQRQDVAAARAG
jgi:signal transduction histidine kinase